MRNNKRWQYFLALSLGVMFLGMGCEDRPDTENVDSFFDGRDISADTRTPTRFPERAAPQDAGQSELVIGPSGALSVGANGDVIEITLNGADGSVSWNVYDGGRGELLTKSRTGATYRRKAAGDNVVTATDQSGRSVSKVIKQPGPAPAEPDDLAIAGPTNPITLEADGMVTGITLSGAQGSVVWSLSSNTRGTLVTTSSSGATYQRLTAGDNVVTATDAAGHSVFIVIRQP